MKCFAVSAGSYSDYRVYAIFATKADAEAHAAQLPPDYGVEEMPFYPEGTVPAMHTIWTAVADERAPKVRISHSRAEAEYDYEVKELKRPKLRVGHLYDQEGRYWTLTAQALDREAALKVCADALAQKIAEREGIS